MVYRSDKTDKGTIVYVGGLLETIKKEAIEAEFEKFGKLTRVWVAFNPPGFAFVEFEKKEDAETAVSALHNADMLGSKLRVEISRGRPRGRGGMSRGGGRGMDRGGFRGHGDFGGDFGGDFRGGRGGDYGRGRGMPRGRGGFGGRPFDRDPYGDRFDDYERGKPDFPDRDFGPPRDFGGRRESGMGRDYGDIGPRGYGAGLDAPARDYPSGRDYPSRDIGGRDYPPSRDVERDYPPRDAGRDFPSRDMGGRGFPPRDVPERDFIPGRDARDFGGRDYGVEREINGGRSYGAPRDIPPVDVPPRPYPGGRDLGVSQATLPGRDYPPVRDVEAARDYAARGAAPPRDYGGARGIGMRREPARDFEQPRDVTNPRDFAPRPTRGEYPTGDRFSGGRGGYNGDMRRPGAAPGGRFSGGRDVGGSGDYGGYGARDRFRSRSPIGRGSRPPIY